MINFSAIVTFLVGFGNKSSILVSKSGRNQSVVKLKRSMQYLTMLWLLLQFTWRQSRDDYESSDSDSDAVEDG